MIENKSLRKFKKRIDRDYDKLEVYYKGEIKDAIKNAAMKKTNNGNGIENFNIFSSDFISDLAKNFIGKDSELIQDYFYLSSIKYNIEKDVAYGNLNNLQKFLDKYNFDRIEQAEVLAAFIRISIERLFEVEKEILNEYDLESIESEEAQKIIDEKVKLGVSREIEDIRNKGLLNQKVSDILKNYHIVAHYIEKNGEITPSNNINPFYNAIKQMPISLTEYQLLLLTNEMQRRYITFKEQEEAMRKKQEIEQQRKLEQEKNDALQEEARKWNQKNANIAKNKLKEYLIDEKPIKYINDVGLKTIISLLRVLNCSETKIARITKNILTNNQLLESEMLLNKFYIARTRFLSDDETALLDEAEAIINGESLDNQPFHEICSNYTLIKEQLLKVADIDDKNVDCNDDVELIILALQELTSALENYKLSDYRYLPKLKKED